MVVSVWMKSAIVSLWKFAVNLCDTLGVGAGEILSNDTTSRLSPNLITAAVSRIWCTKNGSHAFCASFRISLLSGAEKSQRRNTCSPVWVCARLCEDGRRSCAYSAIAPW